MALRSRQLDLVQAALAAARRGRSVWDPIRYLPPFASELAERSAKLYDPAATVDDLTSWVRDALTCMGPTEAVALGHDFGPELSTLGFAVDQTATRLVGGEAGEVASEAASAVVEPLRRALPSVASASKWIVIALVALAALAVASKIPDLSGFGRKRRAA